MTNAPLPMPIRILVKGPSSVSWISFMGGPRTDFTFSRAAEAAILRAGQPVHMHTHSVAAELTRKQIKTWEQEAGGWSPDVVVLAYGHSECVHLLLPLWLQRHAHGLRSRPGPIRERYRKRILGPSWRLLARIQSKIDKAMPVTVFNRKARRIARDLERLVNRLQMVGSPLVLVFDIPRPAPVWQGWFPGMLGRTLIMNKAMADMVERIDKPNVRFFKVTAITEEFIDRGEEPCPDGAHFTPEVHRAIGEQMAEDVLKWAETQEHLRAHLE